MGGFIQQLSPKIFHFTIIEFAHISHAYYAFSSAQDIICPYFIILMHIGRLSLGCDSTNMHEYASQFSPTDTLIILHVIMELVSDCIRYVNEADIMDREKWK